MASISEAPTTIESHTAPAPKQPTSSEPIIFRKGTIWDGPELGRIAADTYYDTELTHFLSPNRGKYRRQYIRGFSNRATQRMFNPRSLTYVACKASNPNLPIGYAQFMRVGDDAGAKKQIESHSRLERIFLFVFGHLFSIYCKLLYLIDPDKSEDHKALQAMFAWEREDDEKHWDSHPERKNRWVAISVVVRSEFQGKKIGKKLMGEVIKRAEEENVPVGLAASAPGEKMYRSVGFELLSRFSNTQSTFEQNEGGIMMWTPPAWKEKDSVKI